MKKGYKSFITKGLLFVVVLVVADYLFGLIISTPFFSQKSGKFYRITNTIEHVDADVLIFGSSAANRHYVPKLFENEFGVSCYNVGVQGQRLIFHLALQKLILKRTTPKVIILNIDQGWLYKSQDAYERLSDLHPYYTENKDVLKPILTLNSEYVDAKLSSKSYQMNSVFLHMIKYYFTPQKDFNGYNPLYGNFEEPQQYQVEKTVLVKKEFAEIDENFVNAFIEFITYAKEKDIKVIFSNSPSFFRTDYSRSKSLLKMREIAKNEKVTFYDFSNHSKFIKQHSLFWKDGVHLNDEGAQQLTKLLIDRIKNDTNQESIFN